MGILIAIGAIILAFKSYIEACKLYINMDYLVFDNIFKKGYKFKFDKVTEEQFKDADTSLHIPEKINTILFLIPGINILFMKFYAYAVANKILHTESIRDGFVELTDKEKEVYSKLDTLFEKINFIDTSFESDIDTEIIGYDKDEGLMIDDPHLYALGIDKLIPLAYTYDEVIKLNKITSNNLKLCNVQGRNIAIIGIPDENNHEPKHVQFLAENDTKLYDTDEVINPEDKNYLIYPYKEYTELDEGIKQIKKEREFIRTQKEKRQ